MGCSGCKFAVCVLQPLNMFCTPIYQLKDFKGVTCTDKWLAKVWKKTPKAKAIASMTLLHWACSWA